LNSPLLQTSLAIVNGSVSAGSVNIGQGTGTAGTLTVNGANGNLLTSTMSVGAASAQGELDVINGAQVSVSGYLFANSATINVSGAGSRLGMGEFLADNSSVNLSGGTIASGDAEEVGINGKSTFTQTGGTNTAGSEFVIGFLQSSVGTYALSGTGSASAGEQFIGYLGTGYFNQTGGVNTSDYQVDLGAQAGSTGVYTLSGSGILSAAKSVVFVGDQGTGIFNQSGGAVTTGALALGYSTGSNGTYALSGNGTLSVAGGSTFLSAFEGVIFVGNQGTGIFNQSGGTVTAAALVQGYSTGSNGTYNLSGNGSLSVTGDEVVGRDGNGTFYQAGGTNTMTGGLTLAADSGTTGNYQFDGGLLTVGGILSIAASSGTTGSMHVTGNGSALNIQTANVGDSGTGSLTVDGGASITATSFITVGNQSGSNGTFTLDGSAATADAFTVGSNGQGHATLTNGASLQLVPITQNRIYIGISDGSTGTLTVTNAATITGLNHNGPAILTVGGVYHSDTTGSGVLNITGGANVTMGEVIVADGSTIANLSSGAIFVSGANSTLQTQSVSIGNGPSFNSASMHVANGAKVSSPAVSLGNGFDPNSDAFDGTGNASLTIDSGSQLMTSEGIEIETGVGQSIFLADGANTLVTGGIAESVGVGVASATFSNGAHLDATSSSPFLEMDRFSAGAALPQMAFTDPGTLATSPNEVLIHEGLLTIANGAEVTSGMANSPSGSAGVIGDDVFHGGGQGEVIVTGAGSTWNANGHLSVGIGNGPADSGQLLIQAGGTVNCVNAYLGRFGNATGTVSVTDPGSSLQVSGSMYVGGNESPATGSTGTVILANGGVMTIANKLMIWPGSTVDISGGLALVGGGTLPTTPGTLDIGPGGTLSGGGTLTGNIFNLGGTVAPADDPQTLTITGNYTQGASSLLRMELGGSQLGKYDQLIVTGSATLGGTLELDLFNGYVPGPGTTFELFNFSNVTPGSQFSSLILPSDVSWDTSKLLTNGTITAIPEPTSIALIGLGGVMMLRRRRSRA